jgi:hypothetical protein
MNARRLLASLVAGVALAAGATLFAPGMASADQPINCATWPNGTPGCEATTGAKVRAELARSLVFFPDATDTQLGLAINGLCQVGVVPANVRPAVAFNLSKLVAVRSKYCG